MTGHVRAGAGKRGMHEHQGEPCWDAHCAPHLTHPDPAVRELIAAAEARGAERERERIADALEALPRAQDEVDDGWVRWGAICDLLAEHRDERPAPEPPSDDYAVGYAMGRGVGVTEDEVADRIAGCISNVADLPEWMQVPALGRDTRPITLLVVRAVLAAFHVTRRDGTR